MKRHLMRKCHVFCFFEVENKNHCLFCCKVNQGKASLRQAFNVIQGCYRISDSKFKLRLTFSKSGKIIAKVLVWVSPKGKNFIRLSNNMTIHTPIKSPCRVDKSREI